MEEWKLEIKKVQNGYILKGNFQDTDMVSETVIEKPDNISDKEAEQHTMRELLWTICEYFGVYYSKHNKANVEINIVPNEEE